MKSKNIGILVIVIGAIMIFYNGFNYITKEKVIDIGPIEINQETNHPIQWSPILGIVLLIGGLLLVVSDRKQ